MEYATSTVNTNSGLPNMALIQKLQLIQRCRAETQYDWPAHRKNKDAVDNTVKKLLFKK